MRNSNVGISRTSASVLAQHEISFLLVAHCLGPYIGSYTPCNRNLVFSLTHPWKASYILHRLFILITNVPILIHVPWLKIVSFSRSCITSWLHCLIILDAIFFNDVTKAIPQDDKYRSSKLAFLDFSSQSITLYFMDQRHRILEHHSGAVDVKR
jgi:hypothetical protein